MPLNEIRPGLRLVNKSNHVSKVLVVVQPGDSLEASEDVAAQIAAQNLDFVPDDHPDAGKALPYPPPVEDEADEPKPKPSKRATRKR